MNIEIKNDLWQRLAHTKKTVVIYGTGNGADKIAELAESRGVRISGYFASGGFVRDRYFRGLRVTDYAGKIAEFGDFIVLLGFGSNRPDVLANIYKIAAEREFYIPDVPVCGDEIFDADYFKRHEDEFKQAYLLFADDRSREVFREIIMFKISGELARLRRSECSHTEVWADILSPENYKSCADLGAYDGDTLRELAEFAPDLTEAIALEPDRKNFARLQKWAESETRFRVVTHNTAAWSESARLTFSASGNRNSNAAGIISGGKSAPQGVFTVKHPAPHGITTAAAASLDEILAGRRADYIKYDVEGSEYAALLGSAKTLSAHRPELCVSAYHRSCDLYKLPRLIARLMPGCRIFLRRFACVPAWEMNLYAVPVRD